MTSGEDDRIRYRRPDELHGTGNSYSHVVSVEPGRTLYVSGQVALDHDGVLVGAGDVAAQTRRAFQNIATALAAEGATFHDVVKLNYYLTDVGALPAVRAVRDDFIGPDRRPASTAVQVVALFEPGLLVEIDAVAVVAAR